MFVISAVMAAAADRFVMGFLIDKNEFGPRNFIKSFAIIFRCCITVTLPVFITGFAPDEAVINYAGVAVLVFLGIKAVAEKDSSNNSNSITAISISVSRDAAVVCLYLVLSGHSLISVAFLSAFCHCVMLAAGSRLSQRIIKNRREIYTKYISRRLFFFMAAYKLRRLL